MLKKLAIFAILILGLALCSCSDEVTTPKHNDPPVLSSVDEKIIYASNEFAFSLFKEVIDEEEDTNILISPLSVSYALGMTYNGAREQTKTDMGTTLGYGSLTDQEINESYRKMTTSLTTLDPLVIFEIANSIWIRNGFPAEQNFIDLNQEYFDAEVANLDFSDENSADIINAWVSDKTHEKIESIVDPPISPTTVMILINAIYFNGTWTYEFDPDNTFEDAFTTSHNQVVQTDFMSESAEYSCMINDVFSAVDLPYGNQDYSMTLFKPRRGKTLDNFLTIFTRENFNSWMSSFEIDSISLKLPKFKFGYGIKLNDALSALGMGIIFTPGLANFNGIAAGWQLFISKVLHKTFIQVDEEGTEAAAVTAVFVELSANPEMPYSFNEPFVFVIHEKSTDAILFIGKVINPIWED